VLKILSPDWYGEYLVKGLSNIPVHHVSDLAIFTSLYLLCGISASHHASDACPPGCRFLIYQTSSRSGIVQMSSSKQSLHQHSCSLSFCRPRGISSLPSKCLNVPHAYPPSLYLTCKGCIFRPIRFPAAAPSRQRNGTADHSGEEIWISVFPQEAERNHRNYDLRAHEQSTHTSGNSQKRKNRDVKKHRERGLFAIFITRNQCFDFR
jgi:hypothetical protein